MTNEEVAVKLEAHEHEIKSLKHRVNEQEAQSKMLQDLTLSVKEWAINSANMMEEQKKQGERMEKQGERLEQLEKQPAEKWNTVTKTIITSIVSTVVGAAITALLAIVAFSQFIK